jgi:hypothetical protein
MAPLSTAWTVLHREAKIVEGQVCTRGAITSVALNGIGEAQGRGLDPPVCKLAGVIVRAIGSPTQLHNPLCRQNPSDFPVSRPDPIRSCRQGTRT